MQQEYTVYSWIDLWMEVYNKPAVKSSSYESQTYYVKMLKHYIDDISLSDLHEIICQKALNKMAEDGYAKATLVKIRTILKKSFACAEHLGFIRRTPADALFVPQAPVKEVVPLTSEQQEKVEAACREIPEARFLLFMLCTGMRRAEVKNLLWTDYDPKKQEIKIRESKTEAGKRTLPLTQKAREILAAVPRSKKDRYIFHSVKGNPLSNTSMKSTYEKVRRLTGIETFTNHTCRHTVATRLCERGANPKSVAAILGHAKVEYALNIYTKIEQQQIRKEIMLLDDNE